MERGPETVAEPVQHLEAEKVAGSRPGAAAVLEEVETAAESKSDLVAALTLEQYFGLESAAGNRPEVVAVSGQR